LRPILLGRLGGVDLIKIYNRKKHIYQKTLRSFSIKEMSDFRKNVIHLYDTSTAEESLHTFD